MRLDSKSALVTDPRPEDRRHRSLWIVVGAVGGAGLGFAIAAAAYTLLVPVLERSSGLVRELQGMAWNLVPLGTLVGLAIGVHVAVRRSGG